MAANNLILPEDYDSITQMPRDFAVLAVRGMSEVNQKDLWRRHIDQSEASAKLTSEQNRFITELFDSTTWSDIEEGKADALALEAIDLFGKQKAFDLFVNLNHRFSPATTDTSSQRPWGDPGDGLNCHCNQMVDFCDPGGMGPDLNCDPSACSNRPLGCGFIFIQNCNGYCQG